jgi:riboflavin synthase
VLGGSFRDHPETSRSRRSPIGPLHPTAHSDTFHLSPHRAVTVSVLHVFTGIVEELGSLITRKDSRLRIAARMVLSDSDLGASIAVNGCCLTVVDKGDDWWEADVSDETFGRTTLGALQPGDPVNLERPMAANGRFGGHIVLGHVDLVGEVVEPAPNLHVRIGTDAMHLVAEKGSIGVDGVSLTVFGLDDDSFRVAVIPHTSTVTTLGVRRARDKVNIELDVLAKHVERLLAPRRGRLMSRVLGRRR